MTNNFETPEYQAWKAGRDEQQEQWREVLLERIANAEHALKEAQDALAAWDADRAGAIVP